MDLANIILDMQDRIIKLEKQVADLRRQVDTITSEEAFDVNEDKNALKQKNMYSRPVAEQIPIEEQIPAEAFAKGRDKTRYCCNGKFYLKNQLVLAVVSDYVQNNQAITCEELRNVFEDRLQGSVGVVVDIDVAKRYNGYEKRFFAEENEVLHLADGDMLVCSQWGILNIPNFVECARGLGYKIEEEKI